MTRHFISLGAGVQSSTMALMAAHGEITPMPEAAIFADTQAEPASVYKWLDWLEKQLPFPVYRVTKGNLSEGKNVLLIPVFIGTGMMRRQCTKHFKLIPIQRKVLSLLDKNENAEMWIGISWDEVDRMKESRHKRIHNCWPLVDAMIRRGDCLRWMEAHSYPEPPRSACVFCPYHNDRSWDRLKHEEPEEFAKAVLYEKKQQELAVKRGFPDVPFLHHDLKPLDTIMFVDHRQQDLFRNECEGMCGV